MSVSSFSARPEVAKNLVSGPAFDGIVNDALARINRIVIGVFSFIEAHYEITLKSSLQLRILGKVLSEPNDVLITFFRDRAARVGMDSLQKYSDEQVQAMNQAAPFNDDFNACRTAAYRSLHGEVGSRATQLEKDLSVKVYAALADEGIGFAPKSKA